MKKNETIGIIRTIEMIFLYLFSVAVLVALIFFSFRINIANMPLQPPFLLMVFVYVMCLALLAVFLYRTAREIAKLMNLSHQKGENYPKKNKVSTLNKNFSWIIMFIGGIGFTLFAIPKRIYYFAKGTPETFWLLMLIGACFLAAGVMELLNIKRESRVREVIALAFIVATAIMMIILFFL